ncbi:RidA family protein [Spongisporangium articulatum]|uniref:RidA family protein n=1 Tax=Spongisporangium articulatum TaxID=3362603 RepID=A0ABW8AS81_9ACTN
MNTITEASISTVNPWTWQDGLGFAQGALVEGGTRTLHVAGQCSLDADGTPVHVGDMAAQAVQVMDNVETVLAHAGLGLADVVRYDVFSTDLQAYFVEGAATVAGRFAAAAGRFPAGGIAAQVAALAMPGLMLEVVVTATR